MLTLWIAAIGGAISLVLVVLFAVYEAGYSHGCEDTAAMLARQERKRKSWLRPHV